LFHQSFTGRHRRSRRGRWRNHDRLAGAQFQWVLDVVVTLKLAGADAVKFANGGQCLAAFNGVSGSASWARHRRGRWRRRGARSLRFADYYAGARTRDLLFEFQNLLGKNVDLRVLLVDLLR